MRRVVPILAVLVALAGAAVYFARGPIALALMERALAGGLAASALDALPDGLHVALCGAGAPLPDEERSGPCVAVVAGERLYVVDAGSGAARNLMRMGLSPGRVEAVLLTHYHSDHIDGLGELLLQRWVGGTHGEPTPVYGPPGVGEVVAGFNRAYRQDAAYRVAHHGERTAPPGGAGGAARAFRPPERGAHTVLESEGLVVATFTVDHDPVRPAVGYRFDYRGRSVLVSGDTSRSPVLEEQARGVDLLVHDALSARLVGVMRRAAEEAGQTARAKIMADIPDYHATPVEAAETARAVGAGHLLLYHIVPPLPLWGLEAVFLEGVGDAWDGPVTLGRDGTLIRLPAGSDAIEADELL